MAKRLVKLRIKENSGVDHPAHLHEGWVVMKAADSDAEVQLPQPLAELVEKADTVHGLLDSLGGFDKSVLDDDGAKMLDALVAELQEELADEGEPDEPPANKNKGDEVPKTAEELQKELEASQAALAKAAGDLEQYKKEHPAEPPKPSTDEEEMAKALEAMPEPIRKRFLESERVAKEAQELAKSEHDRRVEAEYVAKARDTYGNLSVKPEDFGPVLKALHEANPDQAKEVERVLSSANEALRLSTLFKEFGSGAADGADDSPYGQLQALAKQLMEKSNGELSEAQAMAKAVETPEGIRLYERYQAAKMGRS